MKVRLQVIDKTQAPMNKNDEINHHSGINFQDQFFHLHASLAHIIIWISQAEKWGSISLLSRQSDHIYFIPVVIQDK